MEYDDEIYGMWRCGVRWIGRWWCDIWSGGVIYGVAVCYMERLCDIWSSDAMH